MHRIEETITRGICIGCGACSAATGEAVKVTLGRTRLYEAELEGVPEEALRVASRVCPFSDESPNEDQLGAPHPDADMVHDTKLGTYSWTFAGRVADEEYLKGSSSGGLASWLTQRLVSADLVDSVVSVGRTAGAEGEELFRFGASENPAREDARKSQYYATTMADALAQVMQTPGRYAIVGVPCFIRAARALARENETFGTRVQYFVALVCGHFKTHAFADSLAWQAGVHPNDVQAVDFRVKDGARTANDYDFAVKSRKTAETTQVPMRELLGGNWGHSAFQPEACNFCDDVVGETADVSFGDAWLPEYTPYSFGTNVVVSRNRTIDALFRDAAESGELHLFEESADRVADSQAGGFRHRREGLAVRLADDLKAGLSVPRKRVAPTESAVSERRAALIRQRRKMAHESHSVFEQALEADDLSLYLRHYLREAARYRRIELKVHQRIVQRLKRAARRTVNYLQKWTSK